MDLFGENGAIFSQCRRYRYALWRIWDDTKPAVMFIGLNPSTANEGNDDPTIRRVQQFAKRWGYGGVFMLNLFGWVTPYPEELLQCPDPIGENDSYLKDYQEKCAEVIFAWGAFSVATDRAKEVAAMMPGKALVINKNGTPRHPLYVKSEVVPVIFKS